MIWDCVPYWRERRLVAARLELWRRSGLDVTVVTFVGDRTHRGDPKPSGLPAPPPGVRVVDVVLDAGDDWGRERQQRDAVTDLRPEMASDDLVLLCDADEVVDPLAVPRILETAQSGPVRLSMKMYLFDDSNMSTSNWSHAVAMYARDLQGKPSQRHRERHGRFVRIADAGWHLSYQGDVDQKLSSFAHAEVDNDEYRARLAASRANRVDMDGNPFIDCPLTGDIAEALRGIRD
jgi:hypothetical protein